MSMENDLRKKTTNLPNFSPSIASMHLISRLRRSDNDQDAALAMLIEQQDKQEQHMQWITVELRDLSIAHNKVADGLQDNVFRVESIQSQELVQDTKIGVYKSLGMWVIGGIMSLIGVIISWILAKF